MALILPAKFNKGHRRRTEHQHAHRGSSPRQAFRENGGPHRCRIVAVDERTASRPLEFEPMRHASDPPALAQPVLDALLQVDIGLLVIVCR